MITDMHEESKGDDVDIMAAGLPRMESEERIMIEKNSKETLPRKVNFRSTVTEGTKLFTNRKANANHGRPGSK